MSTKLSPVIQKVTERIKQKSQNTRGQYLERIKIAGQKKRAVDTMGCANLAHATAALPANDKLKIFVERAPNIAIISAYNDMLSAHRPYEDYPRIFREEATKLGVTVQMAGGVPAMCDGITQGTAGMELSLFSRDAIAQSTAIALSHNVFDAALLLGVCDKIAPALLIGALHFGHLPCVFVPAGPMTSGLSNKDKATIREQYAQGKVDKSELQKAENAAYHSAGTCTFYGTANSNQMLLDAMGLHLPNAAFITPYTNEREKLTRQALHTAVKITGKGGEKTPIGELVDEKCIVNAMVTLLATGGSTNHLIHWVAVARAAGIQIDWGDFDELSQHVPLIARVYPNGTADINDFHNAGGSPWVLRQLLDAGYLHQDAKNINGNIQTICAPRGQTSKNEEVLRPPTSPFAPTGGLKLLKGNLGRAIIKTSAVPEDRHIIKAPAKIFTSQEEVKTAYDEGELDQDTAVVVLWQGPKANGMPELHKLTPLLAVQQNKGINIMLITDGRMSGASGKVPSAIHITPEAAAGGEITKLRDGDIIELNAKTGELKAHVPEQEWQEREKTQMPEDQIKQNAYGMGRELFTSFRKNVTGAEQGACTWTD